MAPDKKVLLSSGQVPRWLDISGDELPLCRPALQEALNAACESQAFRTSPKSCEFLRHVVLHTLAGDVEELKERLIGMSLLGREASYDTSTDSGVRVRANDVRKRLTSFYESHGTGCEFSIALPAGSYVPRFLRRDPEEPGAETAVEVETAEEEAVSLTPSMEDHPPPQLTLFQLALPMLVAVFLCIVCMRWQLAQEHSFTGFWQQILRGDHALLYLPASRADGKQDLVAIQQLNEVAPLLDLAGQFHHRFTVTSSQSPDSGSNSVLLLVGMPDAGDPKITGPASYLNEPQRFRLIDTPQGRSIVDERNPAQVWSHHAALLTIINSGQSLVSIDGTDENAIRLLVNRLCDEGTFPELLADSFQPGTMMQVVFPYGSYRKAAVDREPLSGLRAALERLQ